MQLVPYKSGFKLGHQHTDFPLLPDTACLFGFKSGSRGSIFITINKKNVMASKYFILWISRPKNCFFISNPWKCGGRTPKGAQAATSLTPRRVLDLWNSPLSLSYDQRIFSWCMCECVSSSDKKSIFLIRLAITCVTSIAHTAEHRETPFGGFMKLTRP